MENISPKAPCHSLGYAIVHLQKGRYFQQIYEELRPEHPKTLQAYRTVYPGRRLSCIFLYTHHPWPKAMEQPESRVCSGELGALAGWCSLLQRCPWRRDLSLRLSFATVSIPTEAASSSQAASPGRECL